MNQPLIVTVLAGCVICAITACTPAPHSTTADPDCLRVEVLDTLLRDGAIIIRPDTPTLEVLPIGQRDIASSVLVPKTSSSQAEIWVVAVTLSRQGAAVLADATRRYFRKQIRISRLGFHSVEPILDAPIDDGKFWISFRSEAKGQEVVRMLGAPCKYIACVPRQVRRPEAPRSESAPLRSLRRGLRHDPSWL